MKIINCEQNSVDWLQARCGVPTASEWDAIISPLGKIRTSDGVKTYLATKVAEWWNGPLPYFTAFATEQGEMLEDEGRKWYAANFDCEVERVGFITDDTGSYGCSPDGLLAGNRGIEIKSPQSVNHVAYLLAGKLPPAYVAQVQGSMLVTGADSWRFLSYRRHFPAFVLTVERDEEFIETLKDALHNFGEFFDLAKARMVELHGGPPRDWKNIKPKPVLAGLSDPDDYRV